MEARDASALYGLAYEDIPLTSSTTLSIKGTSTRANQRFIKSNPGFNVELGARSMETTGSGLDRSLEYSDEHDCFWYTHDFVKPGLVHIDPQKRKCLLHDEDFIAHINFIGNMGASRAIVSIMAVPNSNGDYRGILRRPTGEKIFWISSRELGDKKIQSKHLIAAFQIKFPDFHDITVVEDPELSRALVELELILKIRKYKIGVVYIRDSNSNEDEIFSNDRVSPQFTQFLHFLGQEITLLGWTQYKGDLDVKNGGTGTTAFYRQWQDMEIIFQVASLIPEIRRKPLIGNTISTIVFQESGSFDPGLIVSQVLHVFFVVQPVKGPDGQTLYRVGTASKKGVPRYRPTLPFPSVFAPDDSFREFLLTKLINGERASYHCSSKVRSQKRSLVEIVQQTTSGQLEYAISRANLNMKPKKPSKSLSAIFHTRKKT